MKKNKETKKQASIITTSPVWNYFLYALFAIFLVLFSSSKIAGDDDIFWHLATGKYIYETSSVPSTDIFSFPNEGQRWIPFEWGWDVINFLLFNSFGYWGISVLNILFIIMTFLLLYLILKKYNAADSFIVLFFIILSFAHFERLTVRPHTVSYLFFALLIYLIIQFRYFSRSNYKILYFIPIMFLIWTNMHMGVIAGLGILILFVITEVLIYFKPNLFSSKELAPLAKGNLLKLLYVLLASLTAMLINPNGINTFSYVQHHLQMDAIRQVNEWIPTTNLLFKNYLNINIYLLLLISGSVIIYYSFKKKDYFPLLLYIAFGVNSLRALRYVNDYIIVVTPFIGIAALYLMQINKTGSLNNFLKTNIIPKIILGAVMVYFIISLQNDKIYSNVLHYPRRAGIGIDSSFFPVKMFDFIKENKITELSDKPFNTFTYGGYFLWNFPGKKNFTDSRNVSEDIMDEYNMIFQMKKGFENKIEKFGIEYAMCILQDWVPQYKYLPQFIYKYFFTQNNQWKLIYWDDRAMLFVKNIPKFSGIISNYEYKYINPYNFFFQKILIDRAVQSDIEQVKKEIERKKNEEPNGKIVNAISTNYQSIVK
jgi:hypothetical protein